MNNVEQFGIGILLFLALLFAVYVVSIFQMKGWLHEIKNFLDTELRNYKLKEEKNEGKEE